MSKVWFITGASRGFGYEWATAALERGDRVAATARAVGPLAPLAEQYTDRVLPLALDVNDRQAALTAVGRAHEHFGQLDVVVNNAGYGQFGMLEELSEQEARDQMDTNLFGALWVTQAALPWLRRQGRGHIIQVSSIGGVIAVPGIGMYHASKWALEGFSQALAQEVQGFGIHVTLIEPGSFDTGFGGSSMKHTRPLAAYDGVRQAREQARGAPGTPRGDPGATARALMQVVDAEAPPLRVFFGAAPLETVTHEYERRLALWREWQPLAEAAQGQAVTPEAESM